VVENTLSKANCLGLVVAYIPGGVQVCVLPVATGSARPAVSLRASSCSGSNSSLVLTVLISVSGFITK
jgi:hypothetical protein